MIDIILNSPSIFNNIKYNIINNELYCIYLLQKYCNHSIIFNIVYFNKYLTCIKSMNLYLSIILYYDFYLFLYMISTLYCSRTTNYMIKNYYKKTRPYNRNPLYIKYFNIRKQSYSFPSQSILNISVFYNTIYYYNIYNNTYLFIYFKLWYYLLLISLSITRMYRGLHYPHDIIISYLYGLFLVKFIMWII
jgi:membrane-associated phospholipid phosphatase